MGIESGVRLLPGFPAMFFRADLVHSQSEAERDWVLPGMTWLKCGLLGRVGALLCRPKWRFPIDTSRVPGASPIVVIPLLHAVFHTSAAAKNGEHDPAMTDA